MRRLAAIGATLTVVVLVAVVLSVSSSGAGPGGGSGSYSVRAIFDNAAFAVPGEDVRISGATVGSIASLDVTPEKQAAVTLTINDSRFTPFHANATCAIRPQSLIGERYVDCEPGSSNEPALTRITSGDGNGSYLLPVTRTSSPVDSDIVQDIYTEPVRERFAIILDELGTGLAARGSDLNAVIRRANPALGSTDQVLKILARQNRQLAQLANDSDTVLAPLARDKRQIADFITQANTTAVASAQRAADISRSIQLFPSFLRQLRPLLVDLGQLADAGTPDMTALGQAASALGRQFENLTPFAKAARPALIELGNSSQKSQPALLATIPLAKRLRALGTKSLPSATALDKLTASLAKTGAIGQLMAVLFYGTSAANGFDSIGHYVRSEALVGDCTGYARKPVLGCSANFSAVSPTTSKQASAGVDVVARDATAKLGRKPEESAMKGLLGYLIGGGQ
jgi:virulence factor Mce-like protein